MLRKPGVGVGVQGLNAGFQAGMRRIVVPVEAMKEAPSHWRDAESGVMRAMRERLAVSSDWHGNEEVIICYSPRHREGEPKDSAPQDHATPKTGSKPKPHKIPRTNASEQELPDITDALEKLWLAGKENLRINATGPLAAVAVYTAEPSPPITKKPPAMAVQGPPRDPMPSPSETKDPRKCGKRVGRKKRSNPSGTSEQIWSEVRASGYVRSPKTTKEPWPSSIPTKRGSRIKRNPPP